MKAKAVTWETMQWTSSLGFVITNTSQPQLEIKPPLLCGRFVNYNHLHQYLRNDVAEGEGGSSQELFSKARKLMLLPT